MSAYRLAVYAATIGDLLAEARGDLETDEFATLLTIFATAISKHVAGEIEQRWMEDR